MMKRFFMGVLVPGIGVGNEADFTGLELPVFAFPVKVVEKAHERTAGGGNGVIPWVNTSEGGVWPLRPSTRLGTIWMVANAASGYLGWLILYEGVWCKGVGMDFQIVTKGITTTGSLPRVGQ